MPGLTSWYLRKRALKRISCQAGLFADRLSLRQIIEVDDGFRFRIRRLFEPLVELDPVVEEAAVLHEEVSVFGSAGIVESVAAAGGGIGGKARACDLVPNAFGVADPLVAIMCEALHGTVIH